MKLLKPFWAKKKNEICIVHVRNMLYKCPIKQEVIIKVIWYTYIGEDLISKGFLVLQPTKSNVKEATWKHINKVRQLKKKIMKNSFTILIIIMKHFNILTVKCLPAFSKHR